MRFRVDRAGAGIPAVPVVVEGAEEIYRQKSTRTAHAGGGCRRRSLLSGRYSPRGGTRLLEVLAHVVDDGGLDGLGDGAFLTVAGARAELPGVRRQRGQDSHGAGNAPAHRGGDL